MRLVLLFHFVVGIAASLYHTLPSDAIPSHYNISLVPDLLNWKFDGTVLINIYIPSPITNISLHAQDLIFLENGINLQTENGDRFVGTYKASEKDTSIAILIFEGVIPAGDATLNLEFSGNIRDGLGGFYRSTYDSDASEEVRLGVTQFEALDARLAFPCWDEPIAKATFELSITSSENIVLSNTQIVRRNGNTYKFAQTPRMSTYLVAFIVGNFDYTELQSNGRPIRVYTPVGQSSYGEFAAQDAKNVLEFYEDLFQIDYPLDKLDLIAIPDFDAGAMENWGLITYRNHYILDTEYANQRDREYIALVINHEMAHQWFGNLVTMKWWEDLWLNEGFAEFLETYSSQFLNPTWHFWETFIRDVWMRALEVDGLSSTHPIHREVETKDDIDQLFDTITYDKGASVIRMLWNWVSDEVFFDAIRQYLNTHKYGNAEKQDLWDILESSSGVQFSQVADNWIMQSGYPILYVDRRENTLLIRQKRFFSDPEDFDKDNDQAWSIPLTLSNGSSSTLSAYLLEPNKQEQQIDLPFDIGPVKLNQDAMGFFRVKYSDEMFSSLLEILTELSVLDKMNILADVTQLAISGVSSTTELLEVLDIFCKSEELSGDIWALIYDAISSLESVLLCNDDSARSALFKFGRQCFRSAMDRIGRFPSPTIDTFDNVNARSYLWLGLSRYGDEETIEQAREMFGSDPFGVDVDLQKSIYIATVLGTNTGEIQRRHTRLMSLYTETKDSQLLSRIESGLTAVESPNLLRKTLDMALNETIVRKQDIYSFFARSCGCKGREIVWEYFKENFDTISILDSFGFLAYMIRGFSTQEKYDEINSFFSANELAGTSNSIARGLATLAVNIKWVNRDLSDVHSWLNERHPEKQHHSTQEVLVAVGVTVVVIILVAIIAPAFLCRNQDGSTIMSTGGSGIPAYVDLEETNHSNGGRNGADSFHETL